MTDKPTERPYASQNVLPPPATAKYLLIETNLPTLMTVEEFATECGIARSTAWEIIRRGEIETVIIGERSRRIPRDVFFAYVQSLREAERLGGAS